MQIRGMTFLQLHMAIPVVILPPEECVKSNNMVHILDFYAKKTANEINFFMKIHRAEYIISYIKFLLKSKIVFQLNSWSKFIE